MKPDIKNLFEELTTEQKHFFCFCTLFLDDRNDFPNNFWNDKPKNLNFAEIIAPKSIFSSLLLETAIDFLRKHNAFLTSSTVRVNNSLSHNSTIFEIEDADSLSFALGHLTNLHQIYSLIKALNTESQLPDKTFDFEIPGSDNIDTTSAEFDFKNPENIYDFVLSHIIFQNAQKIFAKELKRKANPTPEIVYKIDDLIRNLISQSPFSVFALSNLRAQQILLKDLEPNMMRQMVEQFLTKPNRIVFFYEDILKNWLSYHEQIYRPENSGELLKYLQKFSELLTEFSEQVKNLNNLHLLKLVLMFYRSFFQKLNQPNWLEQTQDVIKRLRPKSAQSDFVLDLIKTFHPLEAMIKFAEELNDSSFYELNSDEAHFRQCSSKLILQIKENFELFRAKLNRFLAGF